MRNTITCGRELVKQLALRSITLVKNCKKRDLTVPFFLPGDFMKILIALFMFCSFSFAQEETEFDKFVEKQKKENLSDETIKKLEAKPELLPNKGETKFDRLLDETLKPKENKRKKGLIDPLIDRAKEASDS